MSIPPSRRPPRRRDTQGVPDLIRQAKTNLRTAGGVGFLDGRSDLPRPPGSLPIFGDGEDSSTDDWRIVGEDGDRLVLSDLATKIWQLSAEPVEETLVIRFHPNAGAGIEWKRGEHYTLTGSVVTIAAADLAAAHAAVDDVFSAQYLRSTADLIGPTITSPEEGESVQDLTPTISGTGAGGRPIEVFVDGISIGTTTTTSVGTWSLVSTTLAAGAHTAIARQSNPDGSTVDSEEVSFTVIPPSYIGGSGLADAGGPIGNLALPAGTVAGDLIVVAVRANSLSPATNSDARMSVLYSLAGFVIFTGVEDGSGDPVAITATGSGGAAIVIATYHGASNAVVVASDTTGADGSSFSIPTATASNIVAVICEQVSFSSGAGIASLPAGYVLGGYPAPLGTSTGKDTVGIAHWLTDAPPTTSPSGTVTLTASGNWDAFLLEIT